ncbi:MAG: aldehyde dehydrogenase family protein [Chitinophagales bacterium]
MEATMAPPVHTSANTDIKEVKRLYDLQRSNLQNLKNERIADRVSKIEKLQKAVLANREKIEKALYDDFRKPAIHTAFSEIYPVVADCRTYRANLHQWAEPEEIDVPLVFTGTTAKLVYEPKGHCLILSPWNYPFQIPVRALISAVAAGNAVLLKPSEFTPHTAEILKLILKEVFSENEVAVITGDLSVSQAVLDMRFDHIHFTGSPAIGKQIMKKAAETLTSVTLELGGKSPFIIDETANLQKAARNIVFSKYMNNGQTCIAADYILVKEEVKDAFVTALQKEITKSFGADPKTSSAYCRMVNAKHHARVAKLMEDAILKGAKIEAGGQTDIAENYIAPTILTNVTADMLLMQEEIFGPVLPVLGFKTIEEAINLVNAGEKPLALYIFSKRNSAQQYIINNTTSGAVCINDSMIQNSYAGLPFGGVNNSGIGKSYGIWGFKDFSNEKPVVKAYIPPTDLLTPPYNKMSETLVNAMLRFL